MLILCTNVRVHHIMYTHVRLQIQTADGLKLVKFDRVLADVPCSGDGTLRKNVDAWQKWNTAAGHNLHMSVDQYTITCTLFMIKCMCTLKFKFSCIYECMCI